MDQSHGGGLIVGGDEEGERIGRKAAVLYPDPRGGEQQHRLGEGRGVRALAREGDAPAFRVPREARKAGPRTPCAYLVFFASSQPAGY